MASDGSQSAMCGAPIGRKRYCSNITTDPTGKCHLHRAGRVSGGRAGDLGAARSAAARAALDETQPVAPGPDPRIGELAEQLTFSTDERTGRRELHVPDELLIEIHDHLGERGAQALREHGDRCAHCPGCDPEAVDDDLDCDEAGFALEQAIRQGVCRLFDASGWVASDAWSVGADESKRERVAWCRATDTESRDRYGSTWENIIADAWFDTATKSRIYCVGSDV